MPRAAMRGPQPTLRRQPMILFPVAVFLSAPRATISLVVRQGGGTVQKNLVEGAQLSVGGQLVAMAQTAKYIGRFSSARMRSIG
ncbi:MAG: hypothetical protein JWP84_1776 [Tardiphaga sp.]|jgi:hypothetical protein|nr:hypothetical protein [Tardiphaga sp.]